MKSKMILKGVWLFLLFANPYSITVAKEIFPQSLEFEAHLDEQILLTLDIDLETEISRLVEVSVDGFSCDRKILDLGAGKYRILIAPETLFSGQIHGEIEIRAGGTLVGRAINVVGQIRPWIGVRPTKIFLQSIGHGKQFDSPKTVRVSMSSDTTPFDITSVEFPNIEGATWSCEPAPGTPSNEKILFLTIMPNALAAGFPYGALAKKWAIAHTTHPKSMSVPVPIMGMISVNTTGRDYSTYLYSGNLRWQGLWSTPNIAAVFISMSLLLVCGSGASLNARLVRKKGNYLGKHHCSVDNKLPNLIGYIRSRAAGFYFRRWASSSDCVRDLGLKISVFATMAFGCLLLAKTYSRGGWVAMTVGIAVLLLGARKPRIYAIVLACFFIGSILLNPAGLNRAISAGEIDKDKSISHRLLLWEGALQIMAEHPLSGVGVGKFGKVFDREYQAPHHSQNYSTAINDFLTLGTERGIFVLAIVSATFLLLAFTGLKFGIREKIPFLVGCAAAIICSLVASWFSSIVFLSTSSSLLLISASACIVIGVVRKPVQMQFFMKPMLIIWFLLMMFIGGAFAVSGCVALRSRPTIRAINIAGTDGLEVKPRWRTPKGLLIYVGDSSQSPSDLLKNTLLPLARKDWEVLCFEQSEFVSDSYDRLVSVLNELRDVGRLDERWNIAGHRKGAQLALNLAPWSKPYAAAGYMTPMRGSLLNQELAFSANRDYQIYICAPQIDSERSTLHLQEILLLKAAELTGMKYDIYPGDSRESQTWMLWINALDEFLSGVARK